MDDRSSTTEFLARRQVFEAVFVDVRLAEAEQVKVFQIPNVLHARVADLVTPSKFKPMVASDFGNFARPLSVMSRIWKTGILFASGKDFSSFMRDFAG